MGYRIVFLLILFACSFHGIAAVTVGEHAPIQLYSVIACDEMTKDTHAEKVTIQYFIPEKRSGAAIIICPGGAYYTLCDSYEGYQVAHWLNQLGITAILLRYRVGGNLNVAPVDDALNTIKYIRQNADLYEIDPDKIGIMGFSAGGHLASVAATNGKNDTAVNFHILIYPVISLLDQWTHKNSQKNFLGSLLNEENKKQYSSELQVSKDTSMAFVAHSVTDRTVSVENSRMYVDALKKYNIPVSYLELARGGHGFGTGRSPEWKLWQEACKKWLLENKLCIE